MQKRREELLKEQEERKKEKAAEKAAAKEAGGDDSEVEEEEEEAEEEEEEVDIEAVLAEEFEVQTFKQQRGFVYIKHSLKMYMIIKGMLNAWTMPLT